ncbi:MAG: YlxR family protein [Firmicutes bacterium]|nr:YlxR family protein [Bacillota bacterium]
MQQKKLPLRKCVGCQEMKEKRTLIRIVRSEEGVFLLDKTGKANGRGAYICPNPECLAKAKKQKGLERSFKTKISPEIYEELNEALNEAFLRGGFGD